jgi:NAD(P)-dependent dehydrogenase (short-subunit alcohol dehydrogenase family)
VKRLVVTGAASGIGAATVRQALSLGYEVAALDVDPKRLAQMWQDTPVLPLACDVVDADAVSAAFGTAQERWGAPASGLVHAAGIYRVEPAADLAVEQWRGVLDVNATGSFIVCREFGRRALEAGARGSAVLLTSIAYERGDGAEPAAHYAASKGAVVSLTRQLAVEWGKAGIRVNAVAPGVIATPMLRIGDDPDLLAAYLRDRVPLGSLGTADDVASACLFLVGDAAAYISGAVLPVDGGAGIA